MPGLGTGERGASARHKVVRARAQCSLVGVGDEDEADEDQGDTRANRWWWEGSGMGSIFSWLLGGGILSGLRLGKCSCTTLNPNIRHRVDKNLAHEDF